MDKIASVAMAREAVILTVANKDELTDEHLVITNAYEIIHVIITLTSPTHIMHLLRLLFIFLIIISFYL